MIPQAALQTMVTSVELDCLPVVSPSMPEPCALQPAEPQPRPAAASRPTGKHHAFWSGGPLFRKEVVGRKLSIYRQRGKASGEDSKVLDYSEQTQLHKVRFIDRSEEWVNLSDVRFKWLTGPPPGAAPNITWRSCLAKECAVGRKVRVYWPGMAKWYLGTVRSYDASRDLHHVDYKDGDAQDLCLKHEPVVCTDDDHHCQHQQQQQHRGSREGGSSAEPGSARKGSAAAGAADCLGAAAAAAAASAPSPAAHKGAQQDGSSDTAARADQRAKQQQERSRRGRTPPQASTLLNSSTGASAEVSAASGSSHEASQQQQQQKRSAADGRLSGHDSEQDEGRAAKRARHSTPRPSSGKQPASLETKVMLVGCRVGIYWEMDSIFYRAKLIGYNPNTGKFKVNYDDQQYEWLSLERERFRWCAPRARSAGYSLSMHNFMAQLGAEGTGTLEQEAQPAGPPPPPSLPSPAAGGPACEGWRISLYWGGDGQWHKADVLAWDAGQRKHHVLYLDGEEEWVDLAGEVVVWHKHSNQKALSVGPHLSRIGDVMPRGKAAVGWRVAIYWPLDRMFYDGIIREFDSATGRHLIEYDDGDKQHLSLSGEKIIWRLQPEVGADGQALVPSAPMPVEVGLAAVQAAAAASGSAPAVRSKQSAHQRQLQQQASKGSRRPDRALSPAAAAAAAAARPEPPRIRYVPNQPSSRQQLWQQQQQQQQLDSALGRSRRLLKRPERFKDHVAGGEVVSGDDERPGSPPGQLQHQEQELQQQLQPGAQRPGSPPGVRSPPPKSAASSRLQQGTGMLAGGLGLRIPGAFFPVPSKAGAVKHEAPRQAPLQLQALQAPSAPAGQLLPDAPPRLHVRIPEPAPGDPDMGTAMRTQRAASKPAPPLPQVWVALYNDEAAAQQQQQQEQQEVQRRSGAAGLQQVEPAAHLEPAQRAAMQKLNSRLRVLALMSQRLASAASGAGQHLPSPTSAAGAAAAVFAEHLAVAEAAAAEAAAAAALPEPGAGRCSMERLFSWPELATPGSMAQLPPDLLLPPDLADMPLAGGAAGAAGRSAVSPRHLAAAAPPASQGLPLMGKGVLRKLQLVGGGRNNFRPPGSPALAAGLPAALAIPPPFAVPGSAQPSPLVGPMEVPAPLAGAAAAAAQLSDLKPSDIDDLLKDLDDGTGLHLE